MELSILGIGNKSISVVECDGNIWFPAISLGKFLSCSKARISQIICNLGEKRNFSKRFKVCQLEATRRIERVIEFHPLPVAISIASLMRLRVERDQLCEKAIQLKVDFNIEDMLRSRAEVDFGFMVKSILDGITPVMSQYRTGRHILDFYLPGLNLAIEYDEPHHKKTKHIGPDAVREKIIKDRMGVDFLRIKQGEELLGINLIVKRLSCRA